jgi:molybdate/tungstate transport system substrate-binding protein
MMRRVLLAALAAPIIACGTGGGPNGSRQQDTVLVFVAASLTNALRPQLDSFSSQSGAIVLTESGGSVEHARKITDLHRVPDLVILADADVFPRMLAPQHVTWWATFARNRIVIAYTDRSAAHDSITAQNWVAILTRPGVEVGRSDPKIAPVGYRTISLFARAESVYQKPGLATRLLENAPEKNVRANAADLAALLAAGELDYIYDYESVARANAFRFVPLPDAIAGPPVEYALSIPRQAPHATAASHLLQYLMTSGVRAKLCAAHIDMLAAPIVTGTGAPALFTTVTR